MAVYCPLPLFYLDATDFLGCTWQGMNMVDWEDNCGPRGVTSLGINYEYFGARCIDESLGEDNGIAREEYLWSQ